MNSGTCVNLERAYFKVSIGELLSSRRERDRGLVLVLDYDGYSFKFRRVRVLAEVLEIADRGAWTDYLLRDWSGEIVARAWEESKEVLNWAKVGDWIDVFGVVREFRGELYLVPVLASRSSRDNVERRREEIEQIRRVLIRLLGSGQER